jgi:thymidylate kinase
MSFQICDRQQSQKNYHFIVIEGLDGVGKSTTSEHLVEMLQGFSFHTPDSRLNEIRGIFDNSSITTRTAFYNAANHLASEGIKIQLCHSSVVLDRYYGSTLAAAYSHNLFQRAELNSKAKSFSENLMQPDITIHLKIDEKVRVARINNRGKDFNRDERKLIEDREFRTRYLEALDIVSDISIDITDKRSDEIAALIVEYLKNCGDHNPSQSKSSTLCTKKPECSEECLSHRKIHFAS